MNAFCLLMILVAQYHSAFAVWPRTPFEAVNYLLRYGYLSPDYSMRTNPSKLLHYSVKNFQKKSMLKVTGKIDEFTLHQMQKKRCGVPDFSRETLKKLFYGPDIKITISKRDATQAKWNKTDLTFYIKNYTPDLSKEAVDETITEALQVWADVSQLTFKKGNSDSADIIIEFASGEHGDGVPFDGPGGTLAHAYFPETNTNPIEGDAHFDEDERWVLENKQNGTHLFCTAVHEFGHSLGLSHTYSSSDIMYPFDTDCQSQDFRLSENDIYFIQELYGKPDTSVTTPTTTIQTTVRTTPSTERSSTTEKPTTPRFSFTNELTTQRSIVPFPELCKGFLDAITVGADGNIYVFMEYLVFMLGSNGVGQNYYTLISEVFPQAPSTVDSAFTVNLNDYDRNGPASLTYLIKDHQVWKYYFHMDHQQFQLAVGYPRHKHNDFPEAPSSIEAAFYVDGKVYLIDRDSYTEYRYDCEQSTFETPGHTSIRASVYFHKFPRDTSVNAACVDGNSNLNVFVRDDWFIVDHDGVITEKFKTISFFGCDMPTFPDRHKHSHHKHKHSHHKHKHSPYKHKHSPHKRKHSPHKQKHSPHRHKHSPKGHKHPHKKDKKKPKRDKH